MIMHEYHVMFNTQWVLNNIFKYIAVSTAKCLCVHMEYNEDGAH